MSDPKISLVVISFNMERELPRVLGSLSSPYQQNIDEQDIEIIVVDNGSSNPPEAGDLPVNATVYHVENPCGSPARAVNLGLAKANADLVGVFIDGARIASPGLCHYALQAHRSGEKVVISSLGFHLGPDVQMRSIENGYDQAAEDQLLESIDWQNNGYRLFEISVFAGSSAQGWFMPIAESNGLFMNRHLWNELDGYDERFVTPGGGLVNLDTYVRACELPGTQLITLLGEGTFHQVHGGVATNQKRPDANWQVFHDEYRAIRKRDFSKPDARTTYLGSIPDQVIESLRMSVTR